MDKILNNDLIMWIYNRYETYDELRKDYDNHRITIKPSMLRALSILFENEVPKTGIN